MSIQEVNSKASIFLIVVFTKVTGIKLSVTYNEKIYEIPIEMGLKMTLYCLNFIVCMEFRKTCNHQTNKLRILLPFKA